MPTVRAFVALRPPRDLVAAVAAPPYDVVDTAEAAAIAAGNPNCFLRISRPEIGLAPGAAHDEIHRQGRVAFDDFQHRGVLVRGTAPELLVYRQERGEWSQTGVVGAASVADYRSGAIAIHEHTRPDKEMDRTQHIAALGAHDEPVFLMYRPDAPGAGDIAAALARITAGEPEYALVRDGVRHTLWTVPGADAAAIEDAFAQVPVLYVADGHHRSAAAARLAADDPRPGAQEFPAVVFPADELTILGYHRVLRDLRGHTSSSFLAALGESFVVQPSWAGRAGQDADGAPQEMGAAPDLHRHQIGVYLAGSWWTATVRAGLVDESDPIGRLDVSVLQERVLAPLLGIADPRTDARIAFAGGVLGTAELARLVDSGEFAVAFALHPTSPDEVMDVADHGQVMPPKSTWFEPKLASGLFVHPID